MNVDLFFLCGCKVVRDSLPNFALQTDRWKATAERIVSRGRAPVVKMICGPNHGKFSAIFRKRW